MALLSIIVLNHNRLEYSKQTIENLMAKTTIRYEFIFVDNNSKDGTREYLLSLKKRTPAVREQFVFNPFNYGVAGGRNAGLLVARGDYIMTIDDDILVPDHYDKHFEYICKNVRKIGVTGVNVEDRDYPVVPVQGFKVQLKADNLGGGCLCFPRTVINRLGFFDATYVYGSEDVDMHYRVKQMKLLGAYIVPKGKHIDKKDNPEYAKIKRMAHANNSEEVKTTALNMHKYRKTKNVYVPYNVPLDYKSPIDKALKGE